MSPGNLLPETPKTYWRWGVPSLVLAVVTLVAICVSQWIIEPRITSRYQRIVTEELNRLKQSPESVRVAELASQRLMVLQPQSPEYRKLHAQVCLKGAVVFEELGEEDLSNSYRMRGVESIRSASRLGGSEAQWAQAWMLQDEILQGRQQTAHVPYALSDRLKRAMRLREAISSDRLDAMIGSLRIQIGHQWNPEMDLESRTAVLRSGITEIRTALENSSAEHRASLDGLIAKAWLAEGLSSMGSPDALPVAREAILIHSPQLQNLKGDPFVSRRIEAIDAFFRCMVLVSGIREATTAVVSRLDQIPPQEQMLLRHVVIASNFRGLSSSLNLPMGNYASQSESDFLQTALRLGPEHPEVSSMLDAYFFEKTNPADRTYAILFERLENASDDRFVETIKWMKRVVPTSHSQAPSQEISIPKLRESDLELVVGLVGYWISASKRLDVKWENLEALMNSLMSIYPNSGDLKLARAVLAMNLGRWRIAIEDLDKIHRENPKNTWVEKLMIQAEQIRDATIGSEGNKQEQMQ